jgi:hypothetical protein
MYLLRLALVATPLFLSAQQPASVRPQTATNPQAAQPTKPEDKCTIEGQVTNSITNEPLRKAQITVLSTNTQTRSAHGAVSDAGGHFVVTDIDPGQYSIFVVRTGFVDGRYGARGANESGGLLTLSAGQRLNDIAFHLVPHGVVTGRVIDEDGEPVQNAQVSAMRYRFAQGKRQLMPAGGRGTDDLGEYRIFGLAPGKYYFSVRFRRQNTMAQNHTSSSERDQGYAPTYYPGTTDPGGAVAVEVGPGTPLNLADLTLRRTRTVRVRGHVVSSMGEGLPQYMMLRLTPRNTAYFGFYNSIQTQATRSQGGVFELRDVTPGAYLLWVQWWDGDKGHDTHQPIDVGDSNMDDVTLLLTPGLDLKGQVRLDGDGDADLGATWIGIEPQAPIPMGRAGARLEEDRSFMLEGVTADKFWVNVRGLPENFYVKSIRMSDTEALDSGLDLTHGVSGQLEILISPKGGQIEGTVTNAQQQAAGAATVVLVPDEQHREQSSLFKTGRTDQYGHFALRGLAPGDYKLFAWEQVEMGAYQDPEFIKPFENKGENITIREGSRETRQLRLIPADAAPQQGATN